MPPPPNSKNQFEDYKFLNYKNANLPIRNALMLTAVATKSLKIFTSCLFDRFHVTSKCQNVVVDLKSERGTENFSCTVHARTSPF